MIVNMPRPTRPASAGPNGASLRPASARRSLHLKDVACLQPGDMGDELSARRPLSARVQSSRTPTGLPSSSDRPLSARPYMQTGRQIKEPWSGVQAPTMQHQHENHEHMNSVKERTWPPPEANGHCEIMRIAQESLATAHEILHKHGPTPTLYAREECGYEDGHQGSAMEPAVQESDNWHSIPDTVMQQMEKLQLKLQKHDEGTARSRVSADKQAKAYVSWAAHNALTIELANAQNLLREDSTVTDDNDVLDNSPGNENRQDHDMTSAPDFIQGQVPSLLKVSTTPPLLQHPPADLDKDVIKCNMTSERRGIKGNSKRGTGSKHSAYSKNIHKEDEIVGKRRERHVGDPAETRRDALVRSIEAIESLSRALDTVNEEKRVLLSALEVCQTAKSSINQGLMPGNAGGSRRAKACFVAQMLPGVDLKVVERMPAAAISAIEAALTLKLEHAQSTAKLVELQTYADGQPAVTQESMQSGIEWDAKLREEVQRLRRENDTLRVNLMELTQELLGRRKGVNQTESGTALVLSFLQKELAASKARTLVLQSEAASASALARQVTEKANEEKEMLRKEMVSLYARLETFQEGCKHGNELDYRGHGEDQIRESLPVDENADKLEGIRAAADHAVGFVDMEGKEKMSQLEKSAVESNQKILSALIMEFKTQLAENYRQAQTALHKALQDQDDKASLWDTAARLLQRIASLVCAFDTQIAYLQTPEGALSTRARHAPGMVDKDERRNIKDPRELRIAELVEELDSLCVAREMDRRKFHLHENGLQHGGSDFNEHQGILNTDDGASLMDSRKTYQDGEDPEQADNESIDDETRDSLDISFTGRIRGRGGAEEVEAWREAGRLEGQRMIESAEMHARHCFVLETTNNRTDEKNGANMSVCSEVYTEIMQEYSPMCNWCIPGKRSVTAESKEDRKESNRPIIQTQPQTPRSNPHTPRTTGAMYSPRSEELTPRSCGLAENARSLSEGGRKAIESPRYLHPQLQEDHSEGKCASDRTERNEDATEDTQQTSGHSSSQLREGRETWSFTNTNVSSVQFNTGVRGEKVKGMPGLSCPQMNLQRQRTIPLLVEVDAEVEMEGQEEESEVTENTTLTQTDD